MTIEPYTRRIEVISARRLLPFPALPEEALMARSSRSVGVIALSAIVAACGAPESGTPRIAERAQPGAERARGVVEGAWFVRLSQPPLIRGGDPIAIHAERDALRAGLHASGVAHVERYAFERLYNGLSIHLADPRDLDRIRALPGVTAIKPVHLYRLDGAGPHAPSHTAGIAGGATAHTANGAQGGTDSPELFTAIQMTGADVAQTSLGLTGSGIKVGVIDTGIDYTHPDLGGCFGPGCRVAYGTDLVGDAYDAGTAGSVPVPTNDPHDCAGHGTHVAGIVGAHGFVTGVAPSVTYGAYRVFGCAGSTSEDVMAKAMELAEADGMRVVNMSIGSDYEWPESVAGEAADALVSAGVVVVCAAGNSGATGVFAGGSPGDADLAIGAASIDNIGIAQPAFTVSPGGAKIGYTAGAGSPAPPDPPKSGSFPMIRTGTVASASDACTAPAAGSLAGAVALIRRGGCTFYTKAANAVAAGAAGVVLYNNQAGQLTPSLSPPNGSPGITVPVVMITSADGATINGDMDAGPVTMTWTSLIASAPNPTGGQVSSFSSYGPTPELGFKPDIAAPGGSIYSTYPVAMGSYASLSGTSMASPHVAGAAALLLEAHPFLTASEVRDMLQNYAVPVPWPGDTTGMTLDAAHRQGAGLLRIDLAAEGTAWISPGKLALGASAAGPATATLTIHNTAAAAVTYALSHAPAASTTGPYWKPVVAGSGYAAVAFGGGASVTVPANGTASVSVTITADASLADGGVYGGYLVFTPSGGGSALRVPYVGFQGDYASVPILTDGGKGYPQLTQVDPGSGDLVNQPNGATYTLQNGDYPTILVHFDHDVRTFSIDAFDAVKGKPYGNVISEAYDIQNLTQSDAWQYTWYGGTILGKDLVSVPDGDYVLKLSALRALGDPSNPADYETWTSPVITLNHP